MQRCTECLLAAAFSALISPVASGHGPAPGPIHSSATINDPLSHGQLGDNLLSLNEVILLNQRIITRSQLSALELAQIWGFGEDIAWADIDATRVPKITLERDLDPINDVPHGLVIAGSGGRPIIDIGPTRGFLVNSNFVTFRSLTFDGGATAIDMTQTDALFGCLIDDCVFQGQTSSGVTLQLSQDGGTTRFEVDKSKFVGLPTGIEIFDSGANRGGNVTIRRTEFQAGQLGMIVHTGPGGTLALDIDRSKINGTTNGIVLDRPTSADTRQILVSALHFSASGGDVGFSFQGHPAVADQLDMRMLDLSGRDHAIRIWPIGADVHATIEDSRLSGGVQVLGGSTPLGVALANIRMRNGAVDIGTTGGSARISDCVLESVNVTTQGVAGLRIDASRFLMGSLQGTPSAAIQVDGSHMGGVSVGANTSVTNPLPSPQLGSGDVSPLDPVVGSAVSLQADLPPNLTGFWFVGVAETMPVIGPPPLHIYFFLSAYVLVPVPIHNQDIVALPIPNKPVLVGWDYVAQLAVLANPGFLTAPAISMPPGRRFSIR